MTTTTAKTTRTRKTTATARKSAKATAEAEVIFTNVKDIADYYFITAKNVRRLLRQNFKRSDELKNAIYKFDSKESEAIKAFFDAKYKKDTEAK